MSRTKPIDPQAALSEMWALAPKYAEAKGTRIYVEEFRKSLKAQLMKSCGESAIGAQEREAYADETYVNHLRALQAAVELEEKYRWRLIAAQAGIEIWRSQEASNRNIDRAAA